MASRAALAACFMPPFFTMMCGGCGAGVSSVVGIMVATPLPGVSHEATSIRYRLKGFGIPLASVFFPNRTRS